ncbi:MAG TPA: hypothetical protein VM432_04645 [Bdellovibrionales bacterium]|nr:hypothetical protein [Bdellovibrionales bacterium]
MKSVFAAILVSMAASMAWGLPQKTLFIKKTMLEGETSVFYVGYSKDPMKDNQKYRGTMILPMNEEVADNLEMFEINDVKECMAKTMTSDNRLLMYSLEGCR